MKTAATTVNISTLKHFAIEKLSKNSPLKETILAENDQINVNEFLIKLKIWLLLLHHTGRN